MSRSLPHFQRHSETSRLAAISMYERADSEKARVWRWIRQRGEHGSTDEEGYEGLGMPANTYRPRRVDLMDEGLIEKAPDTRLTRAHRKADVWRVKVPAGGVQGGLFSAPTPQVYH